MRPHLQIAVLSAGLAASGCMTPTPEQQANLEPRPSPINGQTVGMAVNNAVEILIHNAKANAAPVDLPSLQARVEDVAWILIQASKRLESGSIESEPPF